MKDSTPRLNFSLTQLEYVLAVHRLGNFSEAARSCFVTQPTLSMQIQKLEEQLGVVLFDRSKKPVLLTEIGLALMNQMQTIVFEARKIEGILTLQNEKGLVGTLNVGVIPTVAPYLLPLLLPKVRDVFPGLQLKIQEMQTQSILAALSLDEIDVGILAVPLGNSSIHESILYTETFSVLCAKDHPLARAKSVKQESLSAKDIWLLEEGHCLRSQILDVCALRLDGGDARQFQFESGSLETLKSLVATFGGYTLVPSLAAKHLLPGTLIVPFGKPIPARDIGLAYVREHYKRNLLMALAEAVKTSVPKELTMMNRKNIEVLPVLAG